MGSEQVKNEIKIVLEKDVSAIFKDSNSVNRVLRVLKDIAKKVLKKWSIK